MQLMWLSGPTANVVTVSIGRKTILTGVLAVAVVLVALGGVLQFLGIRIAVESDPSWARALGGVTSTSEQERIELQYERQIAQLQGRIDGLSEQVDQLAATKRAIVDLVPANPPKQSWLGGQGGPLRRIINLEWFAPKAVDGLVKASAESRELDQRIRSLAKAWGAELDLVAALPLRTPVAVEHHVSSEFGFRRDPITGGLARHSGVDFVAAYGSPILAAAGGVVSQAGYLGAYGLAVDVDHGGGFSTRYAHLSQIAVAKGAEVQPGELSGQLGNTGRSTGPHLHFEVRVNGQPVHPLAQGVLEAAKAQVQSGQWALAEE